jgi:hypothetical protein
MYSSIYIVIHTIVINQCTFVIHKMYIKGIINVHYRYHQCTIVIHKMYIKGIINVH